MSEKGHYVEGKAIPRVDVESNNAKRGYGGTRAAPSRLLGDMRRVYERPEEEDKPRLRPLRQWLKEDAKAFLARLAQLEAVHENRKAKRKAALGQKKEPGKKDDRSAEVLELIEKLLKAAEGKDA